MSNATRMLSVRCAALVAVEISAVTFGLQATADDAVDLFPPELVKFHPSETNPLFQGRGKGNWDEHIRERGPKSCTTDAQTDSTPIDGFLNLMVASIKISPR